MFSVEWTGAPGRVMVGPPERSGLEPETQGGREGRRECWKRIEREA